LSERVRRLTGGLPLFVEDAARLTEAYYHRDTEQFCIAMESLTNVEVTGQQSILSEVYTRLLGRWVDVHSQYAVVLAYDGEVQQAQKLMKSLEPMIGDDKRLQEQFARQSEIIEGVAMSNTAFGSAEEDEAGQFLDAPSIQGRRKIGRNDRCPCGSGLKYKKCCGK
jgi:uncharacterized protein YecA (UPF0149 family)